MMSQLHLINVHVKLTGKKCFLIGKITQQFQSNYREIIETMVQSYSKIFSTQKPVFDGRKNMYTRDDLPIGKDKVII